MISGVLGVGSCMWNYLISCKLSHDSVCLPRTWCIIARVILMAERGLFATIILFLTKTRKNYFVSNSFSFHVMLL
jgi:hypothetical protein